VLANTFPGIDPSLQTGRTREAIVGVDREFGRALHAAADFIYRDYDLGPASYVIPPNGETPAQFVSARSNGWQRQIWTDPATGISAPYYVLNCLDCFLGGGTFVTTNQTHTVDKSVTLSLMKRMADRWQGGLSYTWNDARLFTPAGSFATTGAIGNPTGVEFTNGFTNGTPPHDFKAYGYVELPLGLTSGFNLGVRSGDVRILTIVGPGAVSGASYATLTFQPAGTTRMPVISQLDLNVARTLRFGSKTLTLTLDCFNVLNAATPLGYVSNNVSNNGLGDFSFRTFDAISTITPPRVFRIDARFAF
jgi:hypothetical protein